MRKIPALLSQSALAEKLVSLAREKNITFGTAESCTGGLISAAVTDISGASSVFWGGIVSYDNSIKENLLGVKSETLSTVGAVSEETATQMAMGAVRALSVDFAVSVTGIAGPGGATQNKPVGLVYVGVRYKNKSKVCKCFFSGNRQEVILQATKKALQLLKNTVKK